MATNAGKLIIRQGDQIIRIVLVTRALLRIGRLPDNEVVLELPEVSRHHAELRVEPQAAITITDLGSANGTFLNGDRLLPNQPHPLAPGDTIQIPDATIINVDPFTLVYELAEQPAEIVDEPAPDQADGPAEIAGAPGPDGPSQPDIVVQAPAQPPAADTSAHPALVAGDGATVKDAPAEAGQELSRPSPADAGRQANLAKLTWAATAPQPLPPIIPEPTSPSRYVQYLPIIFHDSEFLRRYLLIFEAIWELLERREDHIELYFDPHTCPVAFLPWLAGWFGLTLNAHWPEGRRRQVLAAAMDLYWHRGTQYGLTRMIEVCTGLSPTITDLSTPSGGAPAQPFMFRIQIDIPPEIDVDLAFVEELVEIHKPAHAGYILEPHMRERS